MTPSASSLTTSPSTSKTHNPKRSRICNLGALLDQVALVGNLNPSYIMETVTRQLVGSYT
jgi:hypothetical protein